MRPLTLAAAALCVGVLLAISGSSASAASAPAAGGQLILAQRNVVYSLPAGGGRPHRLFATPAKMVPTAVSHTGGVIGSVDFKHSWGYPDPAAYSIVVSDLHGGQRHSIGYGQSVALSNDGKWAAIEGVDIHCTKQPRTADAPDPCNALTITRTDGSATGRRVYDNFQSEIAAWSHDGSQLAIVHALNRKLSRLEFITRDNHRVGRTYTLPIGNEVFVQQGDWQRGRIVLSGSTQFGNGFLYDLNTRTGAAWSTGVPATPELWLSRGGGQAVLGGVISWKGDPGGVPGGGVIADSLTDYKTWDAATELWVNQQADESTIPPLHPLYVSKRQFEVIGWAW